MKKAKFLTKTTTRLLALLLCMAASVPQLQADVTIFVRGTAPKLYVFNPNGTAPTDGSTSWSGVQMSQTVQTSDGVTWYYVNYEGLNSCSIIFNDGSNQTENITNVSGTKYYYSNGSDYYLDLTSVKGKNNYVFYENSNGWAEPIKAHFWNGNYSTSWSGDQMTAVGRNGRYGNKIYVWYHDTAIPGMVIFNGNNGSNQTGNLQYRNKYYYYGDGNNPIADYVNIVFPELPQPPQAPDYYVVGANTDLWPNGWSTSNIPASQQMTESNGVYTWSISNVHLDAGNIGFKVYDSNNNYHPSGSGTNININVAAAGTYDLTITYDPNSADDRATYALTPISLDPVTPHYYVTGDFGLGLGGFTCVPTLELTDPDGDGVYTYTTTATADGTYNFVFANGRGADSNDWSNFNNTYRIGPTSGDMDVAINAPFQQTQTAGGDNGAYRITVAAGSVTFYFRPSDMNFRVEATAPAPAVTYYMLGDSELGLQWGDSPTGTAMTYDSATGRFTYTANVTAAGTYHFVFADGTNSSWDYFNNNQRIGPQGGDQNVLVNDDWTTTQKAGGDNGAYSITVGVGTYVFTYDPATSKFQVTGIRPILLTGSNGLGLGWTYEPNVQMTYNQSTGLYSYTYNVAKQGNYNFVFAIGRATGIDNEGDAWNTFNYWYRIGPDANSTGDEMYTIDPENSNNWMSIQMARLGENDEPYSYSVKLPAGQVTIYYNDQDKEFMIETNGELAPDLYMMGGLTYDSIQHYYYPNDAVLMKYDKAKQLYYLNHVTLNTNGTFCFTSAPGESSDDWAGIGTRYGNADTNEHDFVAAHDNITAHFKVTGDKINTNMKLDVWDDEKGEWHMNTAGIYNVVVNLEDGWVKLIKTDNFSLFPMNVYLEQTPNVEISNVQEPNTDYDENMFNGYWPVIAYNGLEGGWDPSSDSNHYAVKFVGDTTTTDGKTWWHWEVSASIAEVMFTRTNQEPYQSQLISRKAGVLWYTWEEDNTLTDHSRDYFTSSATTLPGNVVVDEGHYYAYFINTVGWETVYCVAWNDTVASPLYDGHGNNVETWPGQPMVCIGIDPMTGYEVWEYDFGEIEHTIEPSDLLFHDGTPIATTDAKEQTGDFEFINGGVYDYLGVFDDAYTLNSLIRTAKEHVRYTISNNLLGVYYDDDAETEVTYTLNNGTPTTVIVKGALYAKDFDEYGEKSVQPDGTTDYVYEICPNPATEGGSQIMNKRESYDQSNWIKLVISPNYDGGAHQPVSHDQWPYLKNYVNHVIPAGTLDLYMTDSINPTARVMAITRGEEMTYEPNVYVSAHFNDSIVFHYTHQEWQPKLPDGTQAYKGTYRTRPTVQWHYNSNHEVTHGTVVRERVEEDPYMMFYVAPKPQEIAYVTWIVYDNANQDGAYGDYNNQYYTPTTSVAYKLPDDPGRFYAPMNWDRSVAIDKQYYDSLLYLSENQLEDWLGGYGQKYGPYSNGYMQYGAVKVNWSLFGDSVNHVIRENGEDFAWWQIFEPGQAYKIKALIRYARSDSAGYENNECYGPGNGSSGSGESVHPHGAPLRASADDSNYRYANMYFTSDYSRDGLDASKFIIFPLEASPAGSNGEGMGNVTTVKEVVVPTDVVAVRYYNLMGIGSDRPFEGINIVVTTYSDGTRTSKKILR